MIEDICAHCKFWYPRDEVSDFGQYRRYAPGATANPPEDDDEGFAF